MLYEDKKFVGSKLKQARINRCFSQGQLAEKINLSEKHISNIERGQNFPSLDTFFRMCEVLNLTLEDFGMNIKKEQNIERKILLDKIFSAKDTELKIYSEILNSLDRALTNYCKQVK